MGPGLPGRAGGFAPGPKQDGHPAGEAGHGRCEGGGPEDRIVQEPSAAHLAGAAPGRGKSGGAAVGVQVEHQRLVAVSRNEPARRSLRNPGLLFPAKLGDEIAVWGDGHRVVACQQVHELFKPAIGPPGGGVTAGIVPLMGCEPRVARAAARRRRRRVEVLNEQDRQALGEVVAGGGVGVDENSHPEGWRQGETAEEPLQGAAVAVARIPPREDPDPQAVGPAVDPGRCVEDRRAEGLGGLGAVDPPAVEHPVPQLHQHVAGHVGGGRRGGADGGVLGQVFEALGLEPAIPPCIAGGQAPRQVGGQGRRQAGPGRIGFPETGAGHAQGAEQVPLHQGWIVHPGGPGGDIAGQRRAIVGIGGDLPGRPHPPGTVVRQIGGQRRDPFGAIHQQVAKDAVLEARGVAHQVDDADGRRETLVGDFQDRRQVVIDRGLKLDPAPLDGLHEGDPGEGLGHRGDAEQVPAGIHPPAGGGLAITLEQDHPAVLDHGDGDAGDVVLGHGAQDHPVDESFQLDRRHRGELRDRGAGFGRRSPQHVEQRKSAQHGHGPPPPGPLRARTPPAWGGAGRTPSHQDLRRVRPVTRPRALAISGS